MENTINDFKFQTPTSILIKGKDAVIQAQIHQSSKESALIKYGGDPAALRFYLITYNDESPSILLNEIQVIELLGETYFSSPGKK